MLFWVLFLSLSFIISSYADSDKCLNAYDNKVYENISKINNLNYKLYSTEYLNNKNPNGDIVVSTKKLNDYLNAF